MKNLMASASSQPRKPAMFGALSAQTGIGAIGLNIREAPLSDCELMGSPLSLCGVWQSPHCATCSTRYFPRATAGDPVAEDCACETEMLQRVKISTIIHLTEAPIPA